MEIVKGKMRQKESQMKRKWKQLRGLGSIKEEEEEEKNEEYEEQESFLPSALLPSDLSSATSVSLTPQTLMTDPRAKEQERREPA